MQLIKRLKNHMPHTIRGKKVDVVIRKLLSAEKIRFIPIIIQFRKPMDQILESRVRRMGLKIKYHLPFINGLCGTIPARSFDSLSGLLEISQIFYDGKATLMWDNVMEEKKPADFSIRSYSLSGKGITAAFIDSGIFPHPDLIKPTNRIVAFKDFVNGLENPYDDSGHGTACAGAAYGAAMDGRFRAPAYDTKLVCAKAFDSFSTGNYSDILAAMQWILDIKENFSIRVVVLPFGTATASLDLDVMGLAAKKLWDEGLFVCAPAGNMGPGEGTIASPGAQTDIYTLGACTVDASHPKSAGFSSHGPTHEGFPKPDALLPGCSVTGLNSETDYKPISRASAPSPDILYREVSGTSVSTYLASAAAAMLYQQNPAFKPEDVKAILKLCCQSINETKNIQGHGVVCFSKIDEWSISKG